MTNVNQQNEPHHEPHIKHSEKKENMPKIEDPTLFPANDLSCVNRRCAGFREPRRNKIVFHGELGRYLGLECLHCHTKWNDTGALFRLREAWNTPYYGFFVSLLAALFVWILPFKLLPWSENTKWVVTGLCLLSAANIFVQLWNRSARWYALRQLGYLGHPENVVIPSEIAALLTVQLEGKSASLDGALKDDLLELVQKIQAKVVPTLVEVKHIVGLLEFYGLEQIQSYMRKKNALPSDAKEWVEARLSWFQTIEQNREQWIKDVRLGSDLFETIVGELEALKLGEPIEKDEARRILKETLQDGEELLKRVAELTR